MRTLQYVGTLSCSMLIFCTCLVTAMQAQPPRPRDPFFETMRQVHTENPDLEILYLLTNEKIQTLLELTAEDREATHDRILASIERMRDIQKSQRENPLSAEELKPKIQLILGGIQTEVFAELANRDHLDRLLGIYIQANGPRAAATQQVASRIKLSGPQLEAFRETKEQKWDQLMKDTRKKIDALVRERDRDYRKKIGNIRKDTNQHLNDALNKKLSDDQRDALEQLKGPIIADLQNILEWRQRRRSGPRGRSDKNGSSSHSGDKSKHAGEKRDHMKSPDSDRQAKLDPSDQCHKSNKPNRRRRCQSCLWTPIISYIR